jgi:hypothetical protein
MKCAVNSGIRKLKITTVYIERTHLPSNVCLLLISSAASPSGTHLERAPTKYPCLRPTPANHLLPVLFTFRSATTFAHSTNSTNAANSANSANSTNTLCALFIPLIYDFQADQRAPTSSSFDSPFGHSPNLLVLVVTLITNVFNSTHITSPTLLIILYLILSALIVQILFKEAR